MTDLYIIHGWTYTTEHWNKTLALLEKSGIKAHMLHVPGLTEPSKKVWTIEDYVAWADKNIPNGAIALGHSNGGRILLNLLSQKPEKLSHLILLSSAGVYEKSLKKSFVTTLSKIGAPLKKITIINKAFHKLTGSTDYSHAPENMKKTLQNMLESDKKLKLEKVTTRTHIIWGEADNVTPPRQANVIHQKLPNSKLKFYKKWNHAPYINYPEELSSAITNIVESLQ